MLSAMYAMHTELLCMLGKILLQIVRNVTSSSAMAERPRELDQRFHMGGQFEAIID